MEIVAIFAITNNKNKSNMKYIIKDGKTVMEKGFVRKGVSYTYWFDPVDFPEVTPKYFDTYEQAAEFKTKAKLSDLFTKIVAIA